MKEFFTFLFIAVIIVFLFFGFIKSISKTFLPSQDTQSIDPSKLQESQKRKAQETKEALRQLMLQRQQQLRDFNSRSR